MCEQQPALCPEIFQHAGPCTSGGSRNLAQRRPGGQVTAWVTISRPACLCVLSCVWLFATLWTVVHRIFQARILQSLPFSFPGDLPGPGTKPASPVSPDTGFFLQVDFLPMSHWGSPSPPGCGLKPGERNTYSSFLKEQANKDESKLNYQISREPFSHAI